MERASERAAASRDDIAQLAYQLWEDQGRPDGRDLDFWLQAEQKLNAANDSVTAGTPPKPPELEQAPAAPAPPRRTQSEDENAPRPIRTLAIRGARTSPKPARSARPRSSPVNIILVGAKPAARA